MGKQHRTINGKMLDMDKLALQHEETVAVGNMNINARGDELGPGGQILRTKAQRMQALHELHTMVPESGDVPTSNASEDERALKKQALLDQQEEQRKSVEEEEQRLRAESSKKDDSNLPKGGLASAIAKTQNSNVKVKKL